MRKYSISELYRLWGNYAPSAELLCQRDILRRPKYVHRGSRRNKIYTAKGGKSIPCLWTADRGRLKPDRRVDHTVLARLPRSDVHSPSNRLKAGLFNIRSLTNKASLVSDFIMDHKLDFLCLTETWQQSNDFFHLNQAVPHGFVYICKSRSSGRGGGLALLYRENMKLTPLSVPDHTSFELLAVQIKGPTPTIIAVLYRPPKLSNTFIPELSTVLTALNAMSPNVILMGDFNIHMDNCSNAFTKDFMLDSFGITQHVNCPTHSKGHILDLVCCSGIKPGNCTLGSSYNNELCEFSLPTESAICGLIKKCNSSTCQLDPLPTSLVKSCLPSIAPMITSILTTSLLSGTVPSAFKTAIVRPTLKKPGLDSNNFNNYRPISNLPFLSKVLEKIVATQLQDHLKDNDLFEPFQSGFRPMHSTETAMVKITNDLLCAADDGLISILILLDLSAAFDTISHHVLLERLANIGVRGSAHQWFTSYLSGRTQCVQMMSCKSESTAVTRGVPQGSVLGPLLFIIYLLPLGTILRKHDVQFHCYADDTQLYFSVKPTATLPPAALTACLHDINVWMTQNYLKLNSSKTELLLVGSKSALTKMEPITICVDGSTIPCSKQVKSLGVILDNTISFNAHINTISRNAFFHLRNIARLRPTLTQQSAEVLVNAYVTSRLDYCNSILSGIPNKLLHRLQLIQNSAARIITCSKSTSHITPSLMQLHWLPVAFRINFKVLLLAYKSLNNSAPTYLTDLLEVYTPARPLRSSSAGLLRVPDVNLCTLGERAFSYIAPKLWNSLSDYIRHSDSITVFKSRLKTFFFKKAYGLAN
ncbi:uncharacterized protein LOC134089717 [Sardina pilchardus]|uniref:uncharacterized protein LOC134089717 n=1 Tax=Sardina pilchardus TaxID=27697 RepID=UPI002E1064B4